MHRLDELQPDPPLYPAEPRQRARVEEADRWGDQVLQALARRMTWWTLRHNASAAPSYGQDSRIPLPDFAAVAATQLIARIEWRINDVSEEGTKRDLRELPGDLDRIDAWIGDGTLGAKPTPNAADLQIGSSIALLNTIADVRPMLSGRPALELATSHFSEFPGEMPAATLPAEWIPATGAA